MYNKKITFSNYEIDAIVRNLDSPDSILSTDDPEKRLPISALWIMETNLDKMRDIARKIAKEREKIEMPFSDDEHSEVFEENGQTVRRIKSQYMEDFQKQMAELLDIQNEIEISLVDVNVLERFSVTPRDFRSIKFMLINPEELVKDIENVNEIAEVVS